MEITKEHIYLFFNQHKSMINERYQILDMKLFGSFALGLANKNSDIDIVYTLKEGNKLSFRAYTDLLYFIEDALQRKVDLVNSKNMNPIILKEAEKSMMDLI
jgi:predicted nucleotidyltransferase